MRYSLLLVASRGIKLGELHGVALKMFVNRYILSHISYHQFPCQQCSHCDTLAKPWGGLFIKIFYIINSISVSLVIISCTNIEFMLYLMFPRILRGRLHSTLA